MAALGNPTQVPLHRNVIGSTKGVWVVSVDSTTVSRDDTQIALQLRLTRISAEDETTITRRLYAVVFESDLANPQERVLIADCIRHWVETTQGNGCLLMK